MKTRRCTKCKKQKFLSEFYKDKRTKSGLYPQCKKCSNARHRKYYQLHKTEIAEWYKKYAKTNQSRQAKNKANKKYRQTIKGRLCHCFHMMKDRCYNSKHPRYKDWGGRGIKCLFKTSDEFINYVINKLKIDPHRLQIDRIDNNGHYEKGNIRFVTAKVNSNNRKRKENRNEK